MKISLIIPVYNESGTISACLDNLKCLRGEAEILFADGGSTDDTVAQIGGRYPVVPCSKGRARQMNAAAAAAAGDVLLFSHCDSVLPADTFEEIAEAVGKGTAFGCFHVGFDYDGPLMRCNAWISNELRARRSHIAFGDQGMFFRRKLFSRVGGFPDLPIMEDYALSRRLKRERVPLSVLPGRIITSGRRYRAGHPLMTMWRMFVLRCDYRLGEDPQKIARRYRDIR